MRLSGLGCRRWLLAGFAACWACSSGADAGAGKTEDEMADRQDDSTKTSHDDDAPHNDDSNGNATQGDPRDMPTDDTMSGDDSDTGDADDMQQNDAADDADPREDEPGAPVIDAFATSVAQLPVSGGSVTLTWVVSGAETLTVQTDSGAELVDLVESATLAITEPTTFTLIAENKVGRTTRSVHVELGTGWPIQFGTPESDGVYGIASDLDGNVFVGGTTSGDFNDPATARAYDMFVTKFSPEGALLWKRQLSAADTEYTRSIATDSAGNVIVLGDAVPNDPLDCGLSANDYQVLAKFDSDGELLWRAVNQPEGNLLARQVAIDHDDNLVVTGMLLPVPDRCDPEGTTHWERAFVAKYSPEGELLWTKEAGFGGFGRMDVAIDDGNHLFVVGEFLATESFDADVIAALEPGDQSGALVRYTKDGELLWSQQLVGLSDSLTRAATDGAGNVYVGGELYDPPDGAGHRDVFVAKYDADGQEQWRRLWGTEHPDQLVDVASDAEGDVFVASATQSDPSLASEADFQIRKYSSGGEELWRESFGSYWSEALNTLITDSTGTLFVAGDTERNLFLEGVADGDLRDFNLGDGDAFIVRYPQQGASRTLFPGERAAPH